MKTEDLNKLLLRKLPHLEKNYLSEVAWQEGDSTGSHIVYGDVLTPYLVDCIINEKIREVEEVFAFIEEVLSLKEDYSENVIACSVIESITQLLMERENLQSLLGDASSVIFKEFEKETFPA